MRGRLRVCIIGRGKVGRTLQRELAEAGVDSKLVAGRFRQLPEARSLYLLAVPDAHLCEVALALASHVDAASVVLHCAGARSLSELAALRARGAHVGMFHPLVSFASARAGHGLRDVTFTSFGDSEAVAAARTLARRLHARLVVLKEAPGPAYHAAAALVANGAAALAQLGTQALRQVGFGQRDAEHALSTLLSSVAHNIARVGLPAALTGPVARGDATTVAAHVSALARIDPELAQAYLSLQPAVLATATAAGLDPKLARALARTLSNLSDGTRGRTAPSASRAKPSRAKPSRPKPSATRRRQVEK